MPGIHVQSFSQFDWLDQEKDSLLTIPGSYWLCHKKNIYKFIFRYHRSMKNTTKFSYGRELLKIIRRIIKCQPLQGQQFGTQHLLVTYNCTSWTRQDKMFAIIKFQQKSNAATFSHAFVLTIRIFSSSEQSLFDLKYPIVKEAEAGGTFKELNIAVDSQEKTVRSVTCTTTNTTSSKKSATCENKKIDPEISRHRMKDTLNNTSEISKQLDFQDNTSINELNVNSNCNTKSCNNAASEERIQHHHVDHAISKVIKRKDNIEIKSDQRTKSTKISILDAEIGNQSEKKLNKNIQKCHIISSSKSSLIEIMESSNMCKWSFSDKSTFDSDLEKGVSIMENKNDLNDKRITSNESIINSIDVPYQCFIKKELKDSAHSKEATRFSLPIDKLMQKNNLQENIMKENHINEDSNCQMITTNEHNKISNLVLKSQENDKKNTSLSIKTINNQVQNNAYVKTYKARKQKNREFEKNISDDKILRSSNITDLVMEGLMFTIRQDQDSVAVIEQKTKLEIDEVLENSEKVETKAGEKCLLNSSLLRLENLVTMIDTPRKIEQCKINHTFSTNVEECLLSYNAFSDSSIHALNNTDYINKREIKPNASSYNRAEMAEQLCVNVQSSSNSAIKNIIEEKGQLMEWENSENKQDTKNMFKYDIQMNKKKEEEKDIIPEAFQSTIFSEKEYIKNATREKKTDLQNKNVLMDDMDMEDPIKCNMKKYNKLLSPHSSTASNNTHKKDISRLFKKSRLITQETNIPRVVSNHVITVDEMPLALQKVIQHTCKRRKLSSTNNSKSLAEMKKQCTISTMDISSDTNSNETDASLEETCINSNIPNKHITVSIEKNECNGDKSCSTFDKDISQISGDICEKDVKIDDSKTCTLSEKSLPKHGLSRKLQDITKDFYYDLMQVHNKDKTIQQKCLRQRPRSLNTPDDIKNGKVHIEMLKFIQDITEGAKVVVRRLNIDNKTGLLEKNSVAPCMH